MKVFPRIKIALLFCLISESLFFSIMKIGTYTKDSYKNSDAKLSKAVSKVFRTVVRDNGGFLNAEVYPIAVYRQMVNGINYKIITAVKDAKNKRIELVDSIVYTGPFTDSLYDDPIITYQEKMPKSTNVEDPEIIRIIEKYFYEIESHNRSDFSINSIASSQNANSEETFYLVNASIILNNNPIDVDFVISLDKENETVTILYQFRIYKC